MKWYAVEGNLVGWGIWDLLPFFIKKGPGKKLSGKTEGDKY